MKTCPQPECTQDDPHDDDRQFCVECSAECCAWCATNEGLCPRCTDAERECIDLPDAYDLYALGRWEDRQQ